MTVHHSARFVRHSCLQPFTRHIVPEKGGSESTALQPDRLITPSLSQPLKHSLSEQSRRVKRAAAYSGGSVQVICCRCIGKVECRNDAVAGIALCVLLHKHSFPRRDTRASGKAAWIPVKLIEPRANRDICAKGGAYTVQTSHAADSAGYPNPSRGPRSIREAYRALRP